MERELTTTRLIIAGWRYRSLGKHVIELIPHSLFIGKAVAVSIGLLSLLSMYWLF